MPFETPQTEEQLELSSAIFLGQQSRYYISMQEEGRTSFLDSFEDRNSSLVVCKEKRKISAKVHEAYL